MSHHGHFCSGERGDYTSSFSLLFHWCENIDALTFTYPASHLLLQTFPRFNPSISHLFTFKVEKWPVGSAIESTDNCNWKTPYHCSSMGSMKWRWQQLPFRLFTQLLCYVAKLMEMRRAIMIVIIISS